MTSTDLAAEYFEWVRVQEESRRNFIAANLHLEGKITWQPLSFEQFLESKLKETDNAN